MFWRKKKSKCLKPLSETVEEKKKYEELHESVEFFGGQY